MQTWDQKYKNGMFSFPEAWELKTIERSTTLNSKENDYVFDKYLRCLFIFEDVSSPVSHNFV